MWTKISTQNETDGQYNHQYDIEHDKNRGMYRISEFLDNHWRGEVIFDEAEDTKSNDILEAIVNEYKKFQEFRDGGEIIDRWYNIRDILTTGGWL